jgi:hypothetical protein
VKVFTLYVGTGQPGAKDRLLLILRNHFESFTVISGEGYFRGAAEPMWFVKVATPEHQKVFDTAEEIRSALNQDVVGIEYQNHYYRYTETDRGSALLKLLATEESP